MAITINFFQNLQYLTLLLRISIPKISIGPMTHSGRNMDGERCAVLTQSAIVWTPPFWLVVTALGRNCYPSMTTLLNFAKALFFFFFFQLSHRLPLIIEYWALSRWDNGRTAVTFFLARPRSDQTAQIRAKYASLDEIARFLVHRMDVTKSQLSVNSGILVCLVQEISLFKVFGGRR